MRLSGDAKPSLESEALNKAPLPSLRYLLGYLKPYRLLIVLALCALVITSSSVLGMGYALRYLVDEGIAQGNTALLDRSYGLLMGVIALLAITTFFRFFLVTWVGERVVADIRRDIYQHLLSLDVTFFETRRSGELLSRLTTDTTLIQTVVGSSVSIALRNALLLAGGLVMLCVTSLELTGYVLLIVPLVVAPIIVLGRRVRYLSRATQDRVADLNVHAEETIHAIQTIQAFTLEQRQTQRFTTLIQETLATAKQRIRMRSSLTAIVITLVLGAVATVLWFGGQKVITGSLSAGELSSFVFYAVLVAGSTGAISEVIGDLQRAAGAVERLAELKQERPSLRAVSSNMTASESDMKIPYLQFDNVTFHYPSRPDETALDHISFSVKQGQTLAIVGPSGGGKSTLFRLLLRYYDPPQGTIRLNGQAIDTMALNKLRSRIGIVSQDPVIFSTSAYENISLGNPEAPEEAVREAAQQAEILEFLESLPNGMDTYLGEKGVRLSGGQKQRVAIARALLRAPDLLLLDEATSALDSDNERKVQSALHHATSGRTTLVIAHRLSTVQNADHIVVIDAGQLVAEGVHETLLKTSPLYQTLARQQFDTG